MVKSFEDRESELCGFLRDCRAFQLLRLQCAEHRPFSQGRDTLRTAIARQSLNRQELVLHGRTNISVRSLLKQAVLNASRKARAKRGELFRRLLPVLPEDKVLELGGGDGSHIAAILPEYRNIWIADIDPRALEKAA
jgi:hypothetical protein